MKTVFPNSMVAHVWAQQNQDHGRSGNGNFSFRGADLFSYSRQIAKFAVDREGSVVVLHTSDNSGYMGSQATSQHKSMAIGATRHLPYYYVRSFDNHARNLQSMLGNYAETLAMAKRKRDRPTWLIESFAGDVDTMRRYAESFGIADGVEWPDPIADAAAVNAIFDAKKLRNADPAVIAKRERDKLTRENKVRRDYRECTGKWNADVHDSSWSRPACITDEDILARRAAVGDHYKTQVEAYRRGDEAQEYLPHSFLTDDDKEARKIILRQRSAEEIQKWRNGDPTFAIARHTIQHLITQDDCVARDVALRTMDTAASWLQQLTKADISIRDIESRGFIVTAEERASYQRGLIARHAADIIRWRNGEQVSIPRGEHALLRVRGDAVETSWGASFPVDHAKRVFPLLLACRRSGRDYHRNGQTIHLGHFAIDSLVGDIVTAGCHTVEWIEVEAAARVLNLL